MHLFDNRVDYSSEIAVPSVSQRVSRLILGGVLVASMSLPCAALPETDVFGLFGVQQAWAQDGHGNVVSEISVCGCPATLYEDGTLEFQSGTITTPPTDDEDIWGTFDKSSVKHVVCAEGAIVKIVPSAEADGFEGGLFPGFDELETISLPGLDVSGCRDVGYLFMNLPKVSSIDLTGMNAVGTENLEMLIYDCNSLKTLSLDRANLSGSSLDEFVTECEALETISMRDALLRNCGSIGAAFYELPALKIFDATGVDMSGTEGISYFLGSCSSLEYAYFDNAKFVDVAGLSSLVADAPNMILFSARNFDWSCVERESSGCNLGYLLSNAGVNRIDLSGAVFEGIDSYHSSFFLFDCSGVGEHPVIDLSRTHFVGASHEDDRKVEVAVILGSANDFDIVSFDGASFSNIDVLTDLIDGSDGFVGVDFRNVSLGDISDLSSLFSNSDSVQWVNLTGISAPKLNCILNMFSGMPSLKTIYASPDLDWSHLHEPEIMGPDNVERWESVFDGDVSLVGGQGTAYDEDVYTETHALVDGLNGRPGYFTARQPSQVERNTEATSVATGSGKTDLNMMLLDTGEKGGTSEPLVVPVDAGTGNSDADGTPHIGGDYDKNPFYNPDENSDGLGDNLLFSVPSSINYVVKASGELMAPSNVYVENHSVSPIHTSSLRVDAVDDWHFVSDASVARGVSNAVSLQIGPDANMLNVKPTSDELANGAKDYTAGKYAVGVPSAWNMTAYDGIIGNGDDTLGIKSSGMVANLTKSIMTKQKFGEVRWYVTPGESE